MAPRKKTQKPYKVDEACSGSMVTSLNERIFYAFDAGEITPKNEQETEALEHLVSLGFATAPDGRRWVSPVTEEVAEAANDEEAAEASEEA